MSVLYVDSLQPNLGSGVHIAGHVLQVVHNESTTTFSTSSPSYLPSGLSATITPKYANSIILISWGASCDSQAAGKMVASCPAKNGTLLRSTSTALARATVLWNGAGRSVASVSATMSDTAGTTSPITYEIYVSSLDSYGIYWGYADSPQTITLQEIAQ